jgi:hypothetical protein
MNPLKTKIFVAALSVTSMDLKAVPFHGCTFYKERLQAWSWPGGMNTGCAQFSATFGACTKQKCGFWGCISYSGYWVQGWLPDYFLEVNSVMGKSAFSDSLDGVSLRKHIEIAKKWWRSNLGNVMPFEVGVRSHSYELSSDHKLLYARALSVPYGTVGWTIPTIGSSAGSAMPVCYKAISELAPATWNDLLTSGDRKTAAVWSPLTALVCGLGAPVAGAGQTAKQIISKFPIPTGTMPDSGLPGGCAQPLPVWAQEAGGLTGQGAAAPHCMGALGALLPRTGWVWASDQFNAHQQAAWRIASLAEDYFHQGIGVQPEDKWQQVWPAVPRAQCFIPGGLDRPNNFEPSTYTGDRMTGVFPPIPFSDTPYRQGLSDAVFAVWRKRGTCLEPWEGVAAIADIEAAYFMRLASCKSLNTMDGMP